MAKMLWLFIVAACLCQGCATVHAPEGNATEGNATKGTHGAKGHEKEHEEGTSTASVILLGGIVFLITMYYMVNSHVHGVKKETWSGIATAVSIFVAVMANNMVNKIFRAPGGHHDATPRKALIDAAQLCVTTLVVALLLVVHRKSQLRVYAYGVIGGHILGFGAIDTFATVAGLPNFHDSPWKTLLVFVIYVFAIHVLVLPLRFVFHLLGKCCEGDETSENELERSKKQAEETSIDFFCMGGAFLLSMWMRGMIMGKVVAEHSDGKKHQDTDSLKLVVAGSVFAVLAGVVRLLQHNAKKEKGKKKKTSKVVVEFLDVLGTMASMTAAWCWLDSGNWWYLHKFPKDTMLGHMAVALGATFIFITCIYLFSLVVKHVGPEVKSTLKGEFTSVGLLMGLAWEHVFDTALEGVSPFIADDATPGGRRVLMALLTFALLLGVFPAWVVYIVPNGNKELATVETTPLTAFCDCEGAEDESEGEDEEVLVGSE